MPLILLLEVIKKPNDDEGFNVSAISKHLNNIYREGELERGATISILETVKNENDRKEKKS